MEKLIGILESGKLTRGLALAIVVNGLVIVMLTMITDAPSRFSNFGTGFVLFGFIFYAFLLTQKREREEREERKE